MDKNIEIYLIGISILIFLVIVFLYIRKISNSRELQVKIEPVVDADDKNLKNSGVDNEIIDSSPKTMNQELIIFNLLSVDKSFFDIDQLFGFSNNYGAKLMNGFFQFIDKSSSDTFRVINALNPGTFEENTQTFAVVIVADLNSVKNPPSTVSKMIDFAYEFSEKFHASICDAERAPITKQMISHIETRAQEISRLKQLGENI